MISIAEREHLRELAKKQKDYSELPIMKERVDRWIRHNKLEGEEPMVLMEEITFLNEILPELRCVDETAKVMETQLLQNILAHELINDDKVVPDFFAVEVALNRKLWQQDLKKTVASDGLGYHIEPILEDLEKDLNTLKHTINSYDPIKTKYDLDIAQDVLGDILPVKAINALNRWEFCITKHVVDMMGTENMFIAMLDTPDEFHALMRFVIDDLVSLLRYEEDNNILFLNNGNDYMGSGSYCFNDILTGSGASVKSTDTFGHINSQESVGISPDMYKEFIYPYYLEFSKQFGMLYYGCCEPVHDFFDDCIENYHNLRKVSISPWCDEEFMSQRLSSKKVIYSRKPSPNFIGIEKNFDEAAFRSYIGHTAKLTKDCKKEVIFRDIYKLNGNLEKVRRAVEIVREEFSR